MSKIKENEAFVQEQINHGREYCFKQELPHPKSANRTGNVLAVNGNIVLFKEPHGGFKDGE